MVNILVPTDLSEVSKIAVQYALKIVNKLGGTLTVLHVVTIIQPTRATMRLQLKSLEKELMDTSREDMEAFVKTITKQLKTEVSIKCESGKGYVL